MKLETFNKLLKSSKGNDAHANLDKASLNVIFENGGKVYRYKGTLEQIAHRLGIIPQLNEVEEAERVLAHFLSGDTARISALWACADTVFNMGQDYGINILSDNTTVAKNEYGHKMCEFFVSDSLW